jgi:hypothetical protein
VIDENLRDVTHLLENSSPSDLIDDGVLANIPILNKNHTTDTFETVESFFVTQASHSSIHQHHHHHNCHTTIFHC